MLVGGAILGERFMHVGRVLGLIPNRRPVQTSLHYVGYYYTHFCPLHTPISYQLATIFGSVNVSPPFSRHFFLSVRMTVNVRRRRFEEVS